MLSSGSPSKATRHALLPSVLPRLPLPRQLPRRRHHHRHGRGGRPSARRGRVPRRRRGARPHHHRGDRDALPRRLPVRPPRARRPHRRHHRLRSGGRGTGRVPHRHLPRRRASLARHGRPRDPRDARSHSRVDQHRHPARRTRRVRRTACSPATRCSSAMSAGPTCSPRWASRPTSSPASCTTRCTSGCSPCPTRRRCSLHTAPARRAARTCAPRRSPPSASSAVRTTRSHR